MRNILAIRELQRSLDWETSLGAASSLVVDSESGVLYAAGDGLVVTCHQSKDGEELWRVSLQEAAQQAGFELAPSATLTLFAHAPELEALCIGLSTGELLLLSTPAAAAPGTGLNPGYGSSSSGSGLGMQLEEVGAVEGGVVAGQWSPDGELLALATGAGQLLLMNKDWDLLAEKPLLQHGADTAEAGTPLLAPGSVSLSWRGDARYLATCTQDPTPDSAGDSAPGLAAGSHAGSAPGGGPQQSPAPQSCHIQIWEREGCELHAAGEAAPALYPLLSWQPNGRHLYAVQSLAAARRSAAAAAAAAAATEAAGGAGLDERAQQARIGAWKRELRRKEAEAAAAAAAAGEASNRVLLYERNGLQHGGFDVPGGGEVAGLEWARDSELLALVLRDDDESGLPSHRLQLWHRSNWHWYLKSERRFEGCSGLVARWDEDAPRRLHLLTAEGDYVQLEFGWEPLISSLGTATVVDGRRLLLTPLRHSIVPPPMAAAVVHCSGPVACAAICSFGEDEVLAAVLSDSSLEVAISVEEDLWEETVEEYLESGSDSPGDSTRASAPGEPHLPATRVRVEGGAGAGLVGARQAAWAGEGRLVVLVGASQLVELAINTAAATAAEACTTSAPGPVLRLISRPQGGCILQLEWGQLLQYETGGRLEPSPAGSFPAGCPRMEPTPASAAGALGFATALAFGLTPSGHLYWGSHLVATEVTSFAVRTEGAGGEFLLYTTRSHFLHTLPLASLATPGLPGTAGTAAGTAGIATGVAGTALAGSAFPAAQQQQHQQQQSFGAAMRAAMRPSSSQPSKDVRVRALEQNSVLVAVPPGGEVVVLQLPRGNLEAIRPRALVLPAVAAAIDVGDYGHAWELAAVNRLDLNVLVDYRWPAFLGHAAQFVAQVGDDQDLADLLSSLSPESTLAEGGLYHGALPSSLCPGPASSAASASALQPAAAAGAAGDAAAAEGLANGWGEHGRQNGQAGQGLGATGAAAAAAAPAPAGLQGQQEAAGSRGKVVRVCAALQQALLAAGPSRYLRSILTSYAKCDELEGALALVKQRKEEELQGGAPTDGAPSAEDGLRHLLLFIHEDVVYRAALGMYDLPLAYMVVAHSHKDPGEYMLELQRFAAVHEGPLRCAAIDRHLRRWDKALQSLVAAGEGCFEEALELARERGLLRQLMALCEGKPELRARVLEAYAEELERKNMDEDAGLAYIAAGLPERAIEAYCAAGQWRMALALAGKLGKGPEEMRSLASELASELEGSARLADAALVTLEYLQDVGSAVALLARGREWRECLRVAYSYQRADLVEGVVAPQAARAAAEVLKDVNDNIERVEKYSARLRDIRQRRQDMQAALAAAEEESGLPSRQRDPLDFDDAASEAASMVSGLSIYTDRTHTGATTQAGSTAAPSTVGGRRPQRRSKKGKSSSTRIRQGSPEEEQQLAEHLLSLAPSAALCSEVGQLAEALVLLGHEQDARVLQQRLAALCSAQSAAAADVLQNPPPELAMQLDWRVKQALDAQQAQQARAGGGGGMGLGAAVAAVLAAAPGPVLQLKAAQAEAAQKEARWKWDILRSA